MSIERGKEINSTILYASYGGVIKWIFCCRQEPIDVCLGMELMELSGGEKIYAPHNGKCVYFVNVGEEVVSGEVLARVFI